MLTIAAHTFLDSCAPDPKFSKQERDWKLTFYFDNMNNSYW